MRYNNKTARNALWIMAGRISNKLMVFLSGILVARYLGPERYGILNYVGAYLTFFAALGSLGIDSVLIKSFVDYPEDRGDLLGSAVMLRAVAAALSAAVMTGIVFLVDSRDPLTVGMAVLGSLSLIPRAFDSLKKWFQLRMTSRYAAIASVASCGAATAYKLLLVLMRTDALWFALATVVEYTALALCLLGSYRRQNGPHLSWNRKLAGQLLREGNGFLLSGMMVSVYACTDKLMLGQLMDKNAVACYALAVSLCAVWGFIPEAVIESVHPSILELNGKNPAAFRQRNRKLYAWVFYGSLMLSLVTCLVAEPLVTLLYGSAYASAVGPLRIVVWYTAFSYLGGARNAWVVCRGAQKHLKYLYAAAAAVNVALNFMLIPELGASGAAVASLVTQIAATGILPWMIPALRPNARLMLEGICFVKEKDI